MYEDVKFDVHAATIHGRVYKPNLVEGPCPIVIAHSGIGSVAESFFEHATSFTDLGLAVLFYDHRGYGYSTGEPRQQVDPWQFGRDLRDVITHLEARSDIDETRITLLGLSLGGMVDLVVAATDARVAAVVSIVPPISGWSARKLFPAAALAGLDADLLADRRAQAMGTHPVTLHLTGERVAGGPAVMFTDPEGLEFVKSFEALPSYRNELTLSSIDKIFETELAAYAERISAPLYMILASSDTVAPVADAREFFGRVPEPKKIDEYPGQHYGILLDRYDEILNRSAVWLADTLARVRAAD